MTPDVISSLLIVLSLAQVTANRTSKEKFIIPLFSDSWNMLQYVSGKLKWSPSPDTQSASSRDGSRMRSHTWRVTWQSCFSRIQPVTDVNTRCKQKTMSVTEEPTTSQETPIYSLYHDVYDSGWHCRLIYSESTSSNYNNTEKQRCHFPSGSRPRVHYQVVHQETGKFPGAHLKFCVRFGPRSLLAVIAAVSNFY